MIIEDHVHGPNSQFGITEHMLCQSRLSIMTDITNFAIPTPSAHDCLIPDAFPDHLSISDTLSQLSIITDITDSMVSELSIHPRLIPDTR